MSEFVKSISIWIGGFSLVGFSVGDTAPKDMVILWLFIGFAFFALALAFSFAAGAMAQGAWDEDIADTDAKVQCRIRGVLMFGVAFCFAGLLCIFGAFLAFFFSKTTTHTGFKIASSVILFLALVLLVAVFVTGAALSGNWNKAIDHSD